MRTSYLPSSASGYCTVSRTAAAGDNQASVMGVRAASPNVHGKMGKGCPSRHSNHLTHLSGVWGWEGEGMRTHLDKSELETGTTGRLSKGLCQVMDKTGDPRHCPRLQ